MWSSEGEAKFWMEPSIEVAQSYGLRDVDLRRARELIEEHQDEIRNAWNRHFAS